MQYEKNGLDLSIDFMNLERLRQVETALNRYLKSRTMAPKDSSSADTLTHYCQEIFTLIDDVYGDGAHEQLFGSEISYTEVVDVYEAIVNGLGDVRVQLAQNQLAMAQAQAERRTRVEALETEYARIAAENKAALEADEARINAELQKAQEELDKYAARQVHDTSVPFSDMSSRPKVPLAVAPQETVEARYINDTEPHIYPAGMPLPTL